MELLPNRGNWPGLLKRYVVHRDQHKVVVNEEWDLSAPGCPFVRPWASGLDAQVSNHYINQRVLTPEEFKMHFEEGEHEVRK